MPGNKKKVNLKKLWNIIINMSYMNIICYKNSLNIAHVLYFFNAIIISMRKQRIVQEKK